MGAGRPNRDAANPHDKPVIPRRRKATRLGCWKRSRPERYVTAFLPAAVYFHYAGLVLPVLAGMARWVRQGPATAAAAIGAAAPLTGSVEQVAEDLAELRSLGVDQVFGSMVGTEPDAQLHALELLLAQEER